MKNDDFKNQSTTEQQHLSSKEHWKVWNMSDLFIDSPIYNSENLKLPVWFNNMELSSEEFHLFITGSLNPTIYQFLRKFVNIFS